MYKKSEDILNSIISYTSEVDFKCNEIDKFYQELDPIDILIDQENKEDALNLIRSFTDLEKNIIYLMFGFNSKIYTNQEISKILRIAPKNLINIQKDIFNRLKIESNNKTK